MTNSADEDLYISKPELPICPRCTHYEMDHEDIENCRTCFICKLKGKV